MQYADSDPGGSLAVKLMQVAGEYELNVKRERQRMEQRILQLTERNNELERQRKADIEKIDNLTNMLRSAQAELEKSSGRVDERMKFVDTALMTTRFQAYDRTTQLLEVLSLLMKLDPSSFISGSRPLALDSENIEPEELARGKHPLTDLVMQRCTAFAAWPTLSAVVSDLTKAQSNLSVYSKRSLLLAARQGKVEQVDHILQPSSAFKGNEEANEASAAAYGDVFNDALIAAVQTDQLVMCKKLLSVGASARTRSKDGLYQNALHVATTVGAEAIVKMLISKNVVDVDAQDAYNRTALHLAAAADQGNVAKLLLLNGADPSVTDFQGHMPLDLARGFTADDIDPKRTPCFCSGELKANGASFSVQKVLEDPNVLFWNASLRANKYYGEKRFDKAIEAYSLALELVPKCQSPATPRDLATLHYNRARAQYRLGHHCAAIEDCSAALNHDPTYRNALAQRAECNMSIFDFEKAVKDFQSLLEADPTDKQWTRRLVDARNMRDMSHYGILGLRKDADTGAIKKAYRSLCLRWHPDKHSTSPEDVARAHTAFRRINTAYEVLNDSYKRMMYDLDPKSVYGPDGKDGNDGFDKWYSYEQEKEAERLKERDVAVAKERAEQQHEESNRRAARALRKSRAALLQSHLDNLAAEPTAPQAAVESTVRQPSNESISSRPGALTRAAMAATQSTSSSREQSFIAKVTPPSSPKVTTARATPAAVKTDNVSMTDEEVAAQVAATAARARAAVAQAEAFVKLVHAHSSAAERVSALRPGTAKSVYTHRGDTADAPDVDIPGTVQSRVHSAESTLPEVTQAALNQSERVSDDEADDIEDDDDEGVDGADDPYKAYLRKVTSEGLGSQYYGDGKDDDDDDAELEQGDLSFDDDNLYSQEGYEAGFPASRGSPNASAARMPSLSELEAELEGLTAEAMAAATAARERHHQYEH